MTMMDGCSGVKPAWKQRKVVGMNEIEIAEGAICAAQIVLEAAIKRANLDLDTAPDCSRTKTFVGVNLKELNEAYSLLSHASRLVSSAAQRDRRLEEGRE